MSAHSQMQPIEGTVMNNAGGQSYKISPEKMLLRFLILGSDKPQYYVSEKENNLEHLTNILVMVEEGSGLEIVNTLVNVSVEARAPKQTYTLLVLAICSLSKDLELKKAANEAVQKICRIPTHLFEYLDLREKISLKMNGTTGWGRSQRKVIERWYNEHKNGSELELIRSATKYMSRHGYTHRDALRLGHPKPNSSARKIIYSYLTSGLEKTLKVSEAIRKKMPSPCELSNATAVLDFIIAVEKAKGLGPDKGKEMCELIESHHLVREHIPSELLNSVDVWITLLKRMPLTALIRSLGKISTFTEITECETHIQGIVDKITDKNVIERSKIHPLTVLLAHLTYGHGGGYKGSLTWTPDVRVVSALDTAFELSFKNVVPSSKRILNAVDVSGSMTVSCTGGSGMSITCHEAATVMALIMVRTEPFCHTVFFSSGKDRCCFQHSELEEIPLRKETSLKEAFEMTQRGNFGCTDCALPMMYALSKKIEIDTFIVYTDSETYWGDIHPSEALKKYRTEMNIPNAKLVVMGMQSNKFSIADPNDPGMMDVVGFDSASPQIVSDFSGDRL